MCQKSHHSRHVFVESTHPTPIPNSLSRRRVLGGRRNCRIRPVLLKNPFLHLRLQRQSPSAVFQVWFPDIPGKHGLWTDGPIDQNDGNILGIYTQKSAWFLDLLLRLRETKWSCYYRRHVQGSQNNNCQEFALRFWADWVNLNEQDRRRSKVHVEDLANEDRRKVA